MNYIVLDLEWNQPTQRNRLVREPVKLYGEIIQIGAVKLNSDFEFSDDISIAVAPKYYTEMNRYVKELTGIKTKDLKKGLSFPDAYTEFTEWCGNDYRFITWGPDDMSMLRCNMTLHSIGTDNLPEYFNLQLIFNKQITGESRQFSLGAAMEKLNLPLDLPCHDARNDAVYTARICQLLDMKTGIAEYVAPVPKDKNQIRSKYNSIANHLISEKDITSYDKNSMHCPYCDTPLNITRRLRMRNRDKFFYTNCKNHEAFLVILQRKKPSENVVYKENIYRINEQTESFFRKAELKCAGASKRAKK